MGSRFSPRFSVGCVFFFKSDLVGTLRSASRKLEYLPNDNIFKGKSASASEENSNFYCNWNDQRTRHNFEDLHRLNFIISDFTYNAKKSFLKKSSNISRVIIFVYYGINLLSKFITITKCINIFIQNKKSLMENEWVWISWSVPWRKMSMI